jgi:glutamate racemase
VLGLYDSGLGGLTVLAALRRAGIDQDVAYFADQAHVPYGDRTDVEIQSYHRKNFALLAQRGIDALIMGCNSSCAVASRLGWPPVDFPILDLIATAASSIATTAYRRIAVVATPTTVRSGAYGHAIRVARPQIEVVEVAAPALVPIVERGVAHTEEARKAVEAVIAMLPPALDAVVYGCTHYPLLDRWFAASLPQRVARIDPADAQAAATARLVATLRLPAGSATTTYYTNGDPDAFALAVHRWTGDATGHVSALVA